MNPKNLSTGELLGYLRRAGKRDERLMHVETLPAREEVLAPWPQGIHPAVVAAYAQGGVESLWSHQREALDEVASGKHVVISTGTGSGKSLPAWAPILSDLMEASADLSLAGHRKRPTAL